MPNARQLAERIAADLAPLDRLRRLVHEASHRPDEFSTAFLLGDVRAAVREIDRLSQEESHGDD